MRNTLTLRAAQAQVQAYVTSVGRRPRSAAGDAAQSRCLLASGRLRMAISSFLTAAKPQALLVPHLERNVVVRDLTNPGRPGFLPREVKV